MGLMSAIPGYHGSIRQRRRICDMVLDYDPDARVQKPTDLRVEFKDFCTPLSGLYIVSLFSFCDSQLLTRLPKARRPAAYPVRIGN